LTVKAEVLDSSINWLTKTGIYNNDESNKMAYGGFNAYYDERRKRYPFVYTEITAYAIQLFLYLFRKFRDKFYLERAKRSADWLLNVAKSGGKNIRVRGSFLMGYDLLKKRMIPKAYSFDNGICLSALLNIYGETENQRYYQSAREVGSWLINVMQKSDGSFKPLYDTQRGSYPTNPKNWFEAPGSFHSKIALGLLKLWEVTENSKYLDSARKLCCWTLTQQKVNGQYSSNISSDETNTHAHCYTIEGLLHAFGKLGNDDFLKSAIRAAEWLINAQCSDGGLYQVYKNNWHNRIRLTYAASQAIRVWILLYELTGERKFYDAAIRSLHFVLGMQSENRRDANAYGGFHDFTKRFVVEMKSSTISAWTTIFTIQALLMFEDVDSKNFEEAVNDLF